MLVDVIPFGQSGPRYDRQFEAVINSVHTQYLYLALHVAAQNDSDNNT